MRKSTQIAALIGVSLMVTATLPAQELGTVEDCNLVSVPGGSPENVRNCFAYLTRQITELRAAAMIAAFAATECPDGWTEFEEGAGRFIVGNDGREVWQPRVAGNSLIFTTDGDEEVTLTVAQMPNHLHHTRRAANQPNNNFLRPGGDTSQDPPVGGGVQTSAVGGGQPHNNMPPYIALLWCMPETEEGE